MSPLEASAFLKGLFETAVATAHPTTCLAKHLPADKTGKALVIGAGKASAAMAEAFEAHWQGPIRGLVVTRYDHGAKTDKIQVIEAAHPVPDEEGTLAAKATLELIASAEADETIFCLLSGGGSSLLSMPCAEISLSQKQAVNKQLLKSGASIDEINCVRKHLSAIKGGRLAAACHDKTLITLAISDVPGDAPDVIASGPTVTDPTTREQALSVLERYAIEVPSNIQEWLLSSASETPKPGSESALHRYEIIATPKDSLLAAAEAVKHAGLNALVLGDTLEGESSEVAKVHAAIATFIAQNDLPAAKPCVILSGGETTVTVKGSGRGGRNAEFLLSLFNELKGHPSIYAIACDTDGIDGTEDNAGAYFAPDNYPKSLEQGLNCEAYLANNDGYSFFEQLGTLLKSGPTRTNVNDFRAILILPQ